MTSATDPSIGFVSTYPPTVCGIASYTASMVNALSCRNPDRRIGVVRLSNHRRRTALAPVVFHHRTGDRRSLRMAEEVLDDYDAVSVQHEFGIYGGPDGAEVLELLTNLEVPVVATLHTVLNAPTHRQRTITEEICDLSAKVVVLSETAAVRLTEHYGVAPSRISVLAHGADTSFAGPSLATGDRPLVLTWGLIGPGKGLEWAIEAFTQLARMKPLPRYLIAGATHPNVRRSSGETYRQSLMELTARLGLEHVVEFDDRYLSRSDLAQLVKSADVVVLPYQSTEQVTSGVLVEAIAASKPVVATPFPHAVELLSSGAGAVVPFDDPHQLGGELLHILTDRPARARMAELARRLATDWYWPTVGERFAKIVSDATATSHDFSTSDRRRVAG